MKKLIFFWVFALFSTTCFATIESSTKEKIEHVQTCKLSRKVISNEVYEKLALFLKQKKHAIRVMSFNMLFNSNDSKHPEAYTWPKRIGRVQATLNHWAPDIIGSQELQVSQVKDLKEKFSEQYELLGASDQFLNDNHNDIHENNIIFVKRSRFEVLEFFETSFSEPSSNSFYVAKLKDRASEKIFYVINTHLTFRSPEKRLIEAKNLSMFIRELDAPIILMGDFNTFPLELEKDYPFYDGPIIERELLQNTSLVDSRYTAILGHFGPLSSTNYNPETKVSFSGLGTPNCFLDHIYVSKEISSLFHTTDPLKINGYFPSDHLPVVVEISLP